MVTHTERIRWWILWWRSVLAGWLPWIFCSCDLVMIALAIWDGLIWRIDSGEGLCGIDDFINHSFLLRNLVRGLKVTFCFFFVNDYSVCWSWSWAWSCFCCWALGCVSESLLLSWVVVVECFEGWWVVWLFLVLLIAWFGSNMIKLEEVSLSEEVLFLPGSRNMSIRRSWFTRFPLPLLIVVILSRHV